MYEEDEGQYPKRSPWVTGLTCRCPRCGEGRLYKGFLTVADECQSCGLDLRDAEIGDGPAVFVIFIVGFVVVALAAWVEFSYMPPIWLHMLLWIPAIIILSLGLLRPFKALLIAFQYGYKAREGQIDDK